MVYIQERTRYRSFPSSHTFESNSNSNSNSYSYSYFRYLQSLWNWVDWLNICFYFSFASAYLSGLQELWWDPSIDGNCYLQSIAYVQVNPVCVRCVWCVCGVCAVWCVCAVCV